MNDSVFAFSFYPIKAADLLSNLYIILCKMKDFLLENSEIVQNEQIKMKSNF